MPGGRPTNGAVWSLLVFVILASLMIVLPVVYHLIGGAKAKSTLDELKDWLALRNNAVMAVLMLVFVADLIAKGPSPLVWLSPGPCGREARAVHCRGLLDDARRRPEVILSG